MQSFTVLASTTHIRVSNAGSPLWAGRKVRRPRIRIRLVPRRFWTLLLAGAGAGASAGAGTALFSVVGNLECRCLHFHIFVGQHSPKGKRET